MERYAFYDADCQYVDFKPILAICQRYASYFTFTDNFPRQEKKRCKDYSDILSSLDKYKLHQFKRYNWCGSAKPTLKRQWRWFRFRAFLYFRMYWNRKRIKVYTLNEGSARVLRDFYSDLFVRDASGMQLFYPEDVCFFREDQTIFLSTISHEGVAEFFLTSDELDKIELPKGFKYFSSEMDEFCIERVPVKRRFLKR